MDSNHVTGVLAHQSTTEMEDFMKLQPFYKVLSFELSNYIKNKTYITSTLIPVILCCIILFIPRFFPGLIPGTGSPSSQPPSSEASSFSSEADTSEESSAQPSNSDTYILYDKENLLSDVSLLDKYSSNIRWISALSEQDVTKAVQDETAKAGFVLLSDSHYQYYVNTTSFSDSKQRIFEDILSSYYKDEYFNTHNIDKQEIDALYTQSFSSDTIALKKDSAGNYFYAYILIFVLYFMVLLYGNMIATNVTTEKSSRTIEILVTSTNTNNLLFGKVIAGTIASFIQVGLIFFTILFSYSVNRSAWNGMLDIALNIPGNVLGAFVIFGLLGYLFYMFLFGVLGALVSRTEDISKSTGSIQFAYIIVFLVSMYSLSASDSIWMKIMSYIPFSSSNAMIVRIAIGNVSRIEIFISIVILLISTIVVGILGAKIYRIHTLQYGNPVKLSQALKNIRK